MARGNRYKRWKLRAHDNGIDRHNKGVAHENKQARLEAAHHRQVSGTGKRQPKPAHSKKPKKVSLQERARMASVEGHRPSWLE